MAVAARPQRPQIQISYAWVIAGISFLSLMTTVSARFGFGLFFKPLEQDFGWDKATLSIAVSINMIVFGLAQPVAGYFADRYGPKRVLLGSLLLVALGFLALSQTHTLWQLYLLYGVLVGVGAGGAGFVPMSALIARWFVRRRSLGMGIAFAGAAIGQVVMIPFILFLLAATDWRTSFFILGLGFLAVVIPIISLVVRDSPKTIAAVEPGQREFLAAPSLSIREALRTRTFWLLAGGYSTCGFSITTFAIHLPSYVDDIGLSRGAAATALSVIGATSFLGSVLAGVLGSRFDRKTLLAGTYLLRSVSLALLVLAPAYLWVFIPLIGISWLATVPLTSALTVARFGPASVATMFGIISMSHQAGDAIGVYLSGFLRNATGSYETPFLLVAAALFAASLASFLIEEPKARVPEAKVAGVAPA